MLYELRTYDCCPGRLPALLQLLEEHAKNAWQRAGIRLAGAWTTLIGDHSHRLYYVVAWESLAERDKWEVFLRDPEWVRARDAAQESGPIVARVQNQLLTPTTFSPLQ
jgi:hypothetical protein